MVKAQERLILGSGGSIPPPSALFVSYFKKFKLALPVCEDR